MIRYCISTASPVEAVQRANGEWSVQGFGSSSYDAQIRLIQAFCKPSNVTFFLTTEATECLDRLKNNLSDASSVFMPIETVSPYYYVPQAMSSGKLEYITGYNISEQEQEVIDSATVFSNADLLKPEVYFWSLFLTASFVSFIAVRIAMFYLMMKRFVPISPVHIMKRQLSRMFYYNSEKFKWITFLYSLLCFSMITGFRCLYKTSHIIIEKPFYAKNYKESLDHPLSLAFYYDQYTVVSSAFKNAPHHSIRYKLWAKLAATGRQNDYSGAALNPSSLPAMAAKASYEMTVRRNICIASPLIISLLKSMACSGSREGELWIVKKVADPIENEVIYGYAISKVAYVPSLIEIKLKALFETHFLAHSYEMYLDVSEIAASLLGTSKSHQWKQKVVCENENAFAPEPAVKAISLSYFGSFFKAIAVVWLLAFFIHIFQILNSP